jgi:hypothetical protein
LADSQKIVKRAIVKKTKKMISEYINSHCSEIVISRESVLDEIFVEYFSFLESSAIKKIVDVKIGKKSEYKPILIPVLLDTNKPSPPDIMDIQKKNSTIICQ